MSELRIGLVQMRCEKGAIAANLAAMEEHVRAAQQQGIDIVCFPEASITGYVDPRRYPDAVLRRDDPAVARFAVMTQTSPITALAGIVEANRGGLPYITQVVARAGSVQGFFRKRTIPEDEAALFGPGATAGVFDHPLVRFGVAICADIDNAALFAEHARSGARVVFVAAAPGLYGEQATRDWRAGYAWWQGECHLKLGTYARDHRLCIAVATQAGRTSDEDFPGGGYVYGPDGRCLAATSDESGGALYATIDIAGITEA
jgi:predicted amidohydrolase